MKPLWIELVDKGIANRFEFEDHILIEMNWRLTDYPDLYYNVYQHEINHCDSNYKSKDFLHDMFSRTPGLFKFMKNHLSAWYQVLPFYWDHQRKQIIYDFSAIISWAFVAGVCYGIYSLLGALL